MGWFSLSCVTSLLTINFDVINFWNYQQIMSLFCLTGYYFDNFCPYENTNFTHILIGYYNKGPVFLWMYLTELNRRYLILNFKISPATAFVAREKPPTEEQISTWKVVRDFLENNCKSKWKTIKFSGKVDDISPEWFSVHKHKVMGSRLRSWCKIKPRGGQVWKLCQRLLEFWNFFGGDFGGVFFGFGNFLGIFFWICQKTFWPVCPSDKTWMMTDKSATKRYMINLDFP